MADSRTADKFVIRLPDGLRGRITDRAMANHRSMNSEMVNRLERSLLEDDERADLEQLVRVLTNRIVELEAKLGATE